MTAVGEIDQRIKAVPFWTGDVHWRPLAGGLSNLCFAVEDSTGKYVVRFGQDFPFHHVFRDREIMAAKAAHAAGFAPEVVFAEPGVMVARFVAAKTFTASDVRANIGRVADIVRRFHTEMPRHVSGPGFMFWVFHIIRDYARALKARGSRKSGELPGYLALADQLEAAQVPLPIVYGHHDFLPANILDCGERLWLIDFEYAGFSTPMFDLAGIASNAGFDDACSDELLSAYFGQPPGPALRKAHSAMQCASLLREAMWSMVSEHYLDVPGVDYAAYTDENLELLAKAVDNYRSYHAGN